MAATFIRNGLCLLRVCVCVWTRYVYRYERVTCTFTFGFPHAQIRPLSSTDVDCLAPWALSLTIRWHGHDLCSYFAFLVSTQGFSRHNPQLIEHHRRDTFTPRTKATDSRPENAVCLGCCVYWQHYLPAYIFQRGYIPVITVTRLQIILFPNKWCYASWLAYLGRVTSGCWVLQEDGVCPCCSLGADDDGGGDFGFLLGE